MINDVEYGILNFIQGIRSPSLDVLMIIITYIGSTAILGILPALILMLKKGSRHYGFTIAVSMILGQIAGSLLLKNIVMRPRPFNLPQGILAADTLLISPPMGEYSFPSGHSVTAFSSASALYFYNKKLGVAAYIIAAFIGLSRIYLYVHFPTDVLAGAALGIMCGFFSRFIVNKVLAKAKAQN